MNQVLSHGPTIALQKIAKSYFADFGIDSRATVIVYTSNGKSIAGVPIDYQIDSVNGDCLTIVCKEKETIQLFCRFVVGIEIADMNTLDSYFLYPWQTTPRFGNISKMQLQREAETELKELGLSIQFQAEAFPKNDYFCGACLAWISQLQKVLTSIKSEFPAALEPIKSIQISYADSGTSISKADMSLKIQSNFKIEAFSQSNLQENLNKVL